MSGQTTSKRNKFNTSKMYVCIADVHFLLECIIIGPLFSILGLDTTIVASVIVAAGTIAGASRAFYYNKAKAENLSKQRIRYVLMKLLLENKLTPEAYAEVCSEIDNIDNIFDTKLNSLLQTAVETDAQDQSY